MFLPFNLKCFLIFFMIYCLNQGLFRNGLLNYQVLGNFLHILLLLISDLIPLSPMNIVCVISFGIYPDLFYGVACVLSWWVFHVYFGVVKCSVLCWVSHSGKQMSILVKGKFSTDNLLVDFYSAMCESDSTQS